MTEAIDVVLFSREIQVDGDSICNFFSVQTPGRHGVKSRCVVSYTGPDSGIGKWTCAKDGLITTCSHIPLARQHLQRLVLRDPSAVDPLADNAPNELGGSCFV